jgi:hypothetical protein
MQREVVGTYGVYAEQSYYEINNEIQTPQKTWIWDDQ